MMPKKSFGVVWCYLVVLQEIVILKLLLISC